MKLSRVHLIGKVPPPPGSRSAMNRSLLTSEQFDLELDLDVRLLKVTYGVGQAAGTCFFVPIEQIAMMYPLTETSESAEPLRRGPGRPRKVESAA